MSIVFINLQNTSFSLLSQMPHKNSIVDNIIIIIFFCAVNRESSQPNIFMIQRQVALEEYLHVLGVVAFYLMHFDQQTNNKIPLQ